MESGGGAPPAGELGVAAESAQCPLPPGDEGAAGPAWPLEPEGAAEGGGGPRRALRAVYVRSESPQGGAAGGREAGARRCLLRACEAEGAHLTFVPFGELDFGETAMLDAFYDAVLRLEIHANSIPGPVLQKGDVAVVDMSDVSGQPSLFYHLGVRESFDMANNVILYHHTDADTALSLKASSGNYYFIPYIMTPCADYFCCESDAQRRASEYMQPNWDTILGPLCVPLVDRFTSLLKDIHVTS
ncbi:mitogen-activated protein kinase kinase kinase 15 isoform X2 [Tursiops truncatus]|uniref:mitogen-activated protein kinase kinase kinase 15 isoform X2 n=1 Tax=Tursiops truncatus TaxID=9739 RepID=UPI003CCF3395